MIDHRDTLFERLTAVGTRLCQSDGSIKEPAFQADIKRLLVTVWPMLDPRGRARFINSLDDRLNFDPVRKLTEKELIEAEVVSILHGWPQVLASASAFDRGFALTIMKNRAKPEWWPSDAQITRMKAMWAERSITGMDDVELVE